MNRFSIKPGARKQGEKNNKPLRSLRELADEFGVSMQTVSSAIARHSGPAPVLVHRRRSAGGTQNSWYDPVEMRAWWAKIHA